MEGQRIAGSEVLVAGASQPPGQVTINGRPAENEGIGFRVILDYAGRGRRLIHVMVRDQGFVPAEGWIAICLEPTGGSGLVVPGGPQGHPGGGGNLAIGRLRHGATPARTRAQAARVSCPGG